METLRPQDYFCDCSAIEESERQPSRAKALTSRIGTLMGNFSRIMALALACLLGGCHTESASRESPGADSRAIILAVLAHMVPSYDHLFPFGDKVQPPKLVRFVNLKPPEIRQLKRLCGGRFQIAPWTESMCIGERLTNPDSIREGVILRAGVTWINGSEARAFGVYDRGPGSSICFDYILHKGKGAWHVTSTSCILPS